MQSGLLAVALQHLLCLYQFVINYLALSLAWHLVFEWTTQHKGVDERFCLPKMRALKILFLCPRGLWLSSREQKPCIRPRPCNAYAGRQLAVATSTVCTRPTSFQPNAYCYCMYNLYLVPQKMILWASSRKQNRVSRITEFHERHNLPLRKFVSNLETWWVFVWNYNLPNPKQTPLRCHLVHGSN